MGKRGIVIGFAEPWSLSRLPMFFLLADRIEVSGLRLFSNRRKEYQYYEKISPRRTEITWNNKSVWVGRGWTEDLFQTFIENVKEELGIKITKVN